MALTDKNIVITPNIGQAADPKIVFSGADAVTGPQNITLQVYPNNSGTLSIEGSTGQLFSVTNSMTGTIYSVNDISGIPSIEVLDTGLVKLAQYSGNVLLGTGTDNGTDKLQVAGSISGTTLKGSTLTSTVASGTAPLTVTSTTVVNNLNADLWDGYQFANYLNQSVRTGDAPTFTNIYNNSWFRNNNSNEGLYNQATTQHWSSNANGYWDASSTTSISAIRFYTEGHVANIRGYVYANNSNEIGFLTNAGNWGLRMTSIGTLFPTGAVVEARIAMPANDIAVASGNYFTKTISGNTTLTVSNVPSAGSAGSFILELTNGGSGTITWWSGMKWAGGTAPTLTSSGRDILGFFTHDGGTTWNGLVLAKDVR